MTTDLATAVAGWAPPPTSTSDRITSWPVGALAALLDLPAPVGPLPPLWHWLGFLDHPRQSELGEDGHPADGHFLPPIPERRRMIAGGRIRVHASLPVDEPITRMSTLDRVTVKHGRSGDMAFVTVRHDYRVESGGIAVTEEQDVVYRSQGAGQARAVVRPPAEAAPETDWRFEITPDPAMLFRFSALTYNTHRIHYDEPYVTGVEGFPGLVVHGPLLALLLLEIPRRFVPDRRVASFDYRLMTPSFAGDRLVVGGSASGGSASGDTIELAAHAVGLANSITGIVTLYP
ncbi:MAG TPA: hypothetical protein VFX16_31330 [Pseudonocardiaceae bacterium]|nr:hypothetical protein [Pseudonocardiaceae bacterium]